VREELAEGEGRRGKGQGRGGRGIAPRLLGDRRPCCWVTSVCLRVIRYDEELAQSDVLVQDSRGRLAGNVSLFGAAPTSRTSRQETNTRKPITTSWK